MSNDIQVINTADACKVYLDTVDSSNNVSLNDLLVLSSAIKRNDYTHFFATDLYKIQKKFVGLALSFSKDFMYSVIPGCKHRISSICVTYIEYRRDNGSWSEVGSKTMIGNSANIASLLLNEEKMLQEYFGIASTAKCTVRHFYTNSQFGRLISSISLSSDLYRLGIKIDYSQATKVS